MTKLSCNVTNCASNSNNCCCRGEIKVNGSNACQCGDTACKSFEKKQPGQMSNSLHTGHPEPNSEIRCSAAQCIYNHNGDCTAESIRIDGNGAENCGETKCASFKVR